MKIKDAMTTSNSKHWFEAALDKALLEEERKNRAKNIKNNIKRFRPSSLHNCPRALWYMRKGFMPAEAKPQGYRRMKMGTLIHEFIEYYTKLTPYYSSSEEEIEHNTNTYQIVGHYDLIVNNPQGGKELVEVKSFAEPNTNSKYKLELPKDEHIGQWNYYAYLTDVHEGFIFYMNKRTQEYKTYVQTYDNLRVQRMIKKLERVQEYLDRDEIYPYQENENHSWCDFKEQCEADYYFKGI